METFATLLCMFSMFSGIFFIISLIIQKIRKKTKTKRYSRGLFISIVVFILSIVLFAIFQTPESRAKYEQERIEQQKEKEAKKSTETKEQKETVTQKSKKNKKQKKTTTQKSEKAKEEKETTTQKPEKAKEKKETTTQKSEKAKEKKETAAENSSKKQDQKQNTVQSQISEKHIYDKAKVKDVFNGIRTEKIGQYSIIECSSTEINEEVLADWYYNYVSQNNFNWCMILFTDTKDGDTYLGAYSINGMVEYNVKYTRDQYGDYEYSSNIDNATLYLPNGDGTLSVYSEQ